MKVETSGAKRGFLGGLRFERGQATAEYAILAFWTVIILVSTLQAVRVALLDSYYDMASFMCLPIP